jgi:hypothetical protein
VLSNLGAALHARFEITGDLRAQAEAYQSWRDALDVTSASSSERLSAASQWGTAAARHAVADAAESAYACAVRLLPLVAWRGLRRSAQEDQLSRWPGLGSDAAAWAIRAAHPELAVELIEEGRSVLWMQLLQTRSDLDDIRSTRADVAARLAYLHSELEATVVTLRDNVRVPGR